MNTTTMFSSKTDLWETPFYDCPDCEKRDDCEVVRDARKTHKTYYGVCKNFKKVGVIKIAKA